MKCFAPASLALLAAMDVVTAEIPVLMNSTAGDIKPQIIGGDYICTVQSQGLKRWYYNSKSEGPYDCTEKHDTKEWSMFNAYRSGGSQNVHWKYTDDENDSECLKGWKYYTKDGNTLIATISGRTTMEGDSRRWCALPVYRSGGVEQKQWGKCVCRYIGSPNDRKV